MAHTTLTVACDLCRRMKIKCKRQGSHCEHCLASNAACTFAPLEGKAPKMKRAEQLSLMEQRIQQMEAVLHASGLSSEGRREAPHNEAELADRFSTLMVNESGDAKFIGSASGFSLLSVHSVHWITQKVGSRDLERVIVDFAKCDWATWREYRSELYQSLPDSEREPPPDRDTASLYVNSKLPPLFYSSSAFISFARLFQPFQWNLSAVQSRSL